MSDKVKVKIYDFNTKNKSFIDVTMQLKDDGVKNWAFCLSVLDDRLLEVDPYDPELTDEQRSLIIQECKDNIWYYLREVVRIQEQGGTLGLFKLDRGILAAIYLSRLSISSYMVRPRLTGSSVKSSALLSHSLVFDESDATIVGINDPVEKRTEMTIGEIIDNLPWYMRKGDTGNVKGYALHIRQDYSQDYIRSISTQSSNVYIMDLEYNSHSHELLSYYNNMNDLCDSNSDCKPKYVICTSTVNRSDKSQGAIASKQIRDDCSNLVWDDSMYDMTAAELVTQVKAVSKFCMVIIHCGYSMLGYDDQWFNDICVSLGDVSEIIKGEVLLQRPDEYDSSQYYTPSFSEAEEENDSNECTE